MNNYFYALTELSSLSSVQTAKVLAMTETNQRFDNITHSSLETLSFFSEKIFVKEMEWNRVRGKCKFFSIDDLQEIFVR